MKNSEQTQQRLIDRLTGILQEQYALRLEIIGRKITQVFYHCDTGSRHIHIPDMKVLHLPHGCLWIRTDTGRFYKIATDYLSWNKVDRGILLQEADKKTMTGHAQTIRNRSRLACWRPLLDQKITIAEWNWKGIHNAGHNKGRTISSSYIIDQMFKESLYPESLILHFENNQKIHLIAADPDEKIEGTKRYNLLTAGQEMMVFFCQGKLSEWGLGKTGFEIAQGKS